SSIVASVPSNLTPGSANVVVNSYGVNSSAASFTVTGGGAGWSNSYDYRRAITIHHSQVQGTPTDFPVLISDTYPFLRTTTNGGSVISSSGYDIIFTSDAEGTTPLYFERESYNASTGAATFWVKVPSLSSTTDTIVYMFYGNSAISADQANPNSV